MTFGNSEENIKEQCSNVGVEKECNYAVENKVTERNQYIEEYIKVLDELTKDNSIDYKEINQYSLNDKAVAEKFVDYEYKEKIPGGDDKECVREYFIKTVLASQGMQYNLIYIGLLLILF